MMRPSRQNSTVFKKALHQLLDKEGCGWVVEGGNAFCDMLQAAAAQAAKSTTKSGKGTVSTNVADYKDKDLQTEFASATVTTSVLLELIAHRKRECCLLVLNLVSSTPPCIRQPGPRIRVLGVCDFV
jgi:hypothetical protein